MLLLEQHGLFYGVVVFIRLDSSILIKLLVFIRYYLRVASSESCCWSVRVTFDNNQAKGILASTTNCREH